MNTIYTFCIQ